MQYGLLDRGPFDYLQGLGVVRLIKPIKSTAASYVCIGVSYIHGFLLVHVCVQNDIWSEAVCDQRANLLWFVELHFHLACVYVSKVTPGF